MIQEKIEGNLITHFSDNNKYIKQMETGILYSSATDKIPCLYTYEETEEELPEEEILSEL